MFADGKIVGCQLAFIALVSWTVSTAVCPSGAPTLTDVNSVFVLLLVSGKSTYARTTIIQQNDIMYYYAARTVVLLVEMYDCATLILSRSRALQGCAPLRYTVVVKIAVKFCTTAPTMLRVCRGRKLEEEMLLRKAEADEASTKAAALERNAR